MAGRIVTFKGARDDCPEEIDTKRVINSIYNRRHER